MKKVSKYIAYTIITLVLGVVLFFYISLKISVPVMTGEVLLDGISSDVKIVRDNEGIPHIYAKNKQDMLFALGFVMGSDRLFQYDMIRRAGAGRTAEIIGSKTLPVDILFRTIASNANFKEKVNNLPENIKVELNSFYSGINYYLKNYPKPIEYRILGVDPEPFSIEDAYSVYLYLAYSFSPMLKDKPMYDVINKTVQGRDLNLLHSNKIKGKTITTVIEEKASSLVSSTYANLLNIDQLLSFLSPIEGSNAWVISGKLTKSGAPILSSDPHITFSAPNLWYEAHTIIEDGESFYGHFLPLIPFPAMGHNFHHGWGLTMSYNDDMDLNYENDQKFEQRKSLIKVRGEDDYELSVAVTKHGPLINDIVQRKELISMSWGLYEKSNRPIQAFYHLANAKTMEELKTAVSMAKSPGMNILYADKEGNIGHFILGSLFKRNANTPSTAIKDEFDFGGLYDYELSPHRVNPDNQMLISTNDRPDHAKIEVRGIWYPKNRHDTVEHLLKERESWTMEMMEKVQTSSLDIFALDIRDTIIADLESSLGLDELEKLALEALKAWNGESEISSIGATIYNHFNYLVMPEITDEMNEKERFQYCTTTSSWYFLQRLLKSPNNPWWDISTTTEVEKRSDIVLKVFKSTVADLSQKLGGDVKLWNWGRLHTIEFPHPFGMNKVLGKVFNIGPFPVEGAINDINHFRRKGCQNGHDVKSGPSTRRIVDFADPSTSLGILPLGNSGHMLSPFYDNQRERFLKGEYRLQLMKEADIEKNKAFELLIKKNN
ncbi:penicillin acylase family protein [Bacteriovorax sp. Seq25_V]|uniref:penicillin acylase family protein n=1 Tax=Bacteriovorax sp. Seq25_V TaxID=1201288 RepID=UPI000389E7E2|nr:penicillin acylase family protein [Bacteriovorax sp. Seq25_V]EQC48069.1 penicillin amidase [Bacteriovorax sp. Seq25_V]